MTGAGPRLAFFYGALFLILGMLVAFWPVWLSHRGLDAGEIGMVLAAANACKALANPMIAHAADRTGERKRWIAMLAIATFVVFVPFQWAHGFWPLLILHVALFAAFAPTMALMESLTMLGRRQQGLDYGRVRLWGSLTFIVAVMGGGFLLAGRSPALIYWMMLFAVAATALAGLLLPDFRAPPAAGRGFPLRRVFAIPGFVIFLIATGLIQAGHAVYYAFGTLNWLAAGHSEAIIGMLWAEGVIAEVALFIYGTRLIARVGPAWLIVLGGAASVVRWWITAETTDLGALVVVQLLHALTFGATHLGAIHFIYARAPEDISATAQSVYAVIVASLIIGAASYAAGLLYAVHGGHAYLAMAGTCAVGTLFALVLTRSRAP